MGNDDRPGAGGDPVVSTRVEHERGQWTVYLDALFPDGVISHRLHTYSNQAKADLAARIVRATAERDHRPDWGMP